MNTKTTRQVLIEARALIANGWTTDTYARNDQGRDVDPTDPEATCFCCLGAIANVMGLDDVSEGNAYIATDTPAAVRLKQAAGCSIPTFNDSADDVSEILDAFDRAIALEQP